MAKISSLILIFVAFFVVGPAESFDLTNGAFPIESDYKQEKEKQGGQDPPNYTKVYNRIIPGGVEHAEVKAANGPGSKSMSQMYSKHQSFGSNDVVKTQSITHRKAAAADDDEFMSLADKIRADIEKAQKDSFARHDKMMADLDKSMNMGAFKMPKFPYPADAYNVNPGMEYNNFMQNHMDMMRQMMEMQQAQFQMHQNFFNQARAFQAPYYNSIPSSNYNNYNQNYNSGNSYRIAPTTASRKISDSDAVQEAVLELSTPRIRTSGGYSGAATNDGYSVTRTSSGYSSAGSSGGYPSTGSSSGGYSTSSTSGGYSSYTKSRNQE